MVKLSWPWQLELGDLLQGHLFTWLQGFLPEPHAKPVFVSLRNDGLILGKRLPALSYESVIRDKKITPIILSEDKIKELF